MNNLFAAVILCMSACALQAEDDFGKKILDETGVQSGLIVHLGCGDGDPTASLYASESYMVHGLDTDADQIAFKEMTRFSLYCNQ